MIFSQGGILQILILWLDDMSLEGVVFAALYWLNICNTEILVHHRFDLICTRCMLLHINWQVSYAPNFIQTEAKNDN